MRSWSAGWRLKSFLCLCVVLSTPAKASAERLGKGGTIADVRERTGATLTADLPERDPWTGLEGRTLSDGNLEIDSITDSSQQDMDSLVFDRDQAVSTIVTSSPAVFTQLRADVRWRTEHHRLPDPKRPPLVIYNKTNQPVEQVLASLSKPVRTVEFFHGIPSSLAEAKIVYPDLAIKAGASRSEKNTLGDDAFWQQLNNQFTVAMPNAVDIGKNLARPPRNTSKTEKYSSALPRLLQAAKDRGTDMAVISGEIQGGRMRFPDKSNIPVADLAKISIQIAVVCCNSANHVVPSPGQAIIAIGDRIKYQQAFQIGSFISQVAQYNAQTSDQSAQKTLYEMLLSMQQARLTQEAPKPTGHAQGNDSPVFTTTPEQENPVRPPSDGYGPTFLGPPAPEKNYLQGPAAPVATSKVVVVSVRVIVHQNGSITFQALPS